MASAEPDIWTFTTLEELEANFELARANQNQYNDASRNDASWAAADQHFRQYSKTSYNLFSGLLSRYQEFCSKNSVSVFPISGAWVALYLASISPLAAGTLVTYGRQFNSVREATVDIWDVPADSPFRVPFNDYPPLKQLGVMISATPRKIKLRGSELKTPDNSPTKQTGEALPAPLETGRRKRTRVSNAEKTPVRIIKRAKQDLETIEDEEIKSASVNNPPETQDPQLNGISTVLAPSPPVKRRPGRPRKSNAPFDMESREPKREVEAVELQKVEDTSPPKPKPKPRVRREPKPRASSTTGRRFTRNMKRQEEEVVEQVERESVEEESAVTEVKLEPGEELGLFGRIKRWFGYINPLETIV